MNRLLRVAGIGLALAVPVAVVTAAVSELTALPSLVPVAGPGEMPPSPWRVVGFPGQTKPFTRFSGATVDGQRVLRLDANLSYGFLVHAVAVSDSVRLLSWRWRIDEPNPASDLKRKDGDDSPAKVCAMFDLPFESVPFVERQVLKLAQLRAGEHIPAGNVCYVWDANLPQGTVLESAYTRRIRVIVLRGADAPLRTWVTDERDLRADFLRLYADEAKGKVPPLVGIAIGADADNTRRRTVAHVGQVVLN